MKVAIILAAGNGERFFPYNLTRQKCALPIANVPNVRRLVDELRRLGLQRFIVVTGQHGGQVKSALAGAEGVQFIHQDLPKGTAAAVAQASVELDGEGDFLVVYGDIVTAPENLAALLRTHREHQAEVSVLVQALNGMDSRDWIGVSVTNGVVSEVVGHPRSAKYRVGGAFAFRSTALAYVEKNPGVMAHVPVGGMPPLEAELGQSLQMMVEDKRELAAVECVEFLVDMDKPWHILEANGLLISYLAKRLEADVIPGSAKVSDLAEIRGRLVLGEGCEIGNRVVIEGALWCGSGTRITNGAILRGSNVLGRECRVRDYCLLGGQTTLGNRCIVGHGAEFDGVAFDTVYLYHYCEVSGVLGNAVDIGAATVCGTLRFDDKETVHVVRGRREIPNVGANATYIGDYCRTGVNAIIMPGCKIGPYSIVGPGVVLYEDLPPRTMVLVKQELTYKEWGPQKYGW